MLNRSRLSLILGSLIFALSTASSTLPAQTCGASCLTCVGAPSPDYKYGGGASGTRYLAFCKLGGCSSCGFTLKKQSSEQASALVTALRTAPAPELLKLLGRSGSRVRLLPTRNLAVVLGGCNQDAVERVVSLSVEKTRLLAEAGIGDWSVRVDSLSERVGRKQVASR